MDEQSKESSLIKDVATLVADMTWVKKILSNHYQFQQKLIFGLIIGLLGLIGSLIVVLVS